MQNYVGPYRATTTDEFLELALGTPLELWLGEEGESAEQQAARQAAARDIIADDPSLFDRTTALAADVIGRTMPELLALAPAPRPAVPVRLRARRRGMAA
jgi:hypothetical protein